MSWRAPSPLTKLGLKPGLVVGLWLASVVAGFAVLVRYPAQPGILARAPVAWPEGHDGILAPDRHTLILFAHPHCPCTRATFDELDRIAADCDGRLRIVVCFASAPELGEAWVHTGSWDRAARIPGVDVREDRSGILAHELGVETSGQALLYAADGRLCFQGGITSSRGHAGDNAGEAAIVGLVHGRAPECTRTAVFGCRLVGADEQCASGATP